MKTLRPHIPRRDAKREEPADALESTTTKDGHTTVILHGRAFGPVGLEVEQVPVAWARTGMPALMRASAKSGRAFLIQNAKNPSAASALLINPDVLRARLERLRSTRTLGQLLESLPFKRHGSPRLTVELPDDGVAGLRIPSALKVVGRRAKVK